MRLPGAQMCLSPDLLRELSLLRRNRQSFRVFLCLCYFTELNLVQTPSMVQQRGQKNMEISQDDGRDRGYSPRCVEVNRMTSLMGEPP